MAGTSVTRTAGASHICRSTFVALFWHYFNRDDEHEFRMCEWDHPSTCRWHPWCTSVYVLHTPRPTPALKIRLQIRNSVPSASCDALRAVILWSDSCVHVHCTMYMYICRVICTCSMNVVTYLLYVEPFISFLKCVVHMYWYWHNFDKHWRVLCGQWLHTRQWQT